ncbi:MAG: sulfite exporter TauE/SafE family protein, partial [Hyphomicrobium sp.]
MSQTELTFFGGLLLGFASTLHCSAMCGGISCSALLSLGGRTHAERLKHSLLLQIGRILSYCLLGGIGAALGSTFLSPQKTLTFHTMQWMAAVVLMWTGLAMAGMLPRLLLLDSVMVRISGFFERIMSPLCGTSAAPVSLGLLWGLNP